MHGVHIGFRKERSWSRVDRRNDKLMSIAQLTKVAGPNKPSDVVSKAGPPISLRYHRDGSIYAVMAYIVVSRFYEKYATLLWYHHLVVSLCVLSPKSIVVARKKEFGAVSHKGFVFGVDHIFRSYWSQ